MISFRRAFVGLGLVWLGALPALSAAAAAPARVGDDQITEEVQTLLKQHAALMVEPVPIRVQTIDGVVYLRGVVDTGLEKKLAGAYARRAPDAIKVINDISFRGN